MIARVWFLTATLVEAVRVKRREEQRVRAMAGDAWIDALGQLVTPDPVITDAWRRQHEVGMVRPTVSRNRRAGWRRGAET